MRSRTQNSAQNMIVGLGGQGVEAVLKFVGRTVFLRCLSVTYLGVNGLFSEILTMLSLAELGIGTAIVYALYKPLRDRDEAKIAAWMELFRKAYTAIGIFTGVVGCALIPFLSYIVKNTGELEGQIRTIYLFYLFNTVIAYFFSYKSTLLIADQKNYIVQLVRQGCSVARTVAQCVILLLTRNFYLYLLMESIFIVVNNVGLSLFVDRRYSFLKQRRDSNALDGHAKKTLWGNVRALVLVKTSTLLVNSTDNTIISILGGVVEVGLYSNYSMVITMAASLLNQVFGGLSASIGNLNAEGDREKSYSIFESVHLANFWLFAWVSIGFAVMINPVIRVWLGADFLLSPAAVAVIAVNFYIKGMMNSVWIFKDTFGLFRYGRFMSFATAVLNLAFSVLLGLKFGLLGILGATALSRLVTNVWYDPYALFKRGFERSVSGYYLRYLLYGLLAAGTYCLTAWLCRMVPGEGIGALVWNFGIACVIPNAVFLLALGKTAPFALLQEKGLMLAHGVVHGKRGTDE